MYHFQENITDNNGTALNGWSMDLFAVGGDPETAPAITIYSDRAGTLPIAGGKVRAVSKGLVQFYVPTGRYSRRYYDTAGEYQYAVLDSDFLSAGDVSALEVRPAYAHAQHFWRTIRAGQDDVYVFINSDSTWNQTTEPLYRWVAEYLAPAVPTHSIVYRLWVDGSGWNTPTTVQTGTGSRTIYIDNAAVAGSGLVYGQGANEVAQNSDGRTYDLVLINHGHNFGSTTTAAQNYALILTAVANMMQRHAKADFLVTLQNPWLRNLAFSRATQGVWRQVATELGLGIIDVASKFEALGDLDDPAIGGEGGTVDLAYYDQDGQGGLHPAPPAGVNLALPAFAEALAENPATGASAMIRPFSRPAVNLMPNPAFTTWTGSAPEGHTLTNVVASKSVAYVERGLYGLALTPNAGASPVKAVDLSNLLPVAKGRWLTYLARIWVPASMTTTAGRAQLLTTGTISRSFTSQPSSVGRDGWRWVMAYHQVLETDTSITANLLCGEAAGADNGKTFYVDREIIVIGTMPGELDESWMTGAFVPDFYNFRQTGIPSGFTGTLALSGAASNTMTVTSGTANLTRAFGNFNTVPGRVYRVSWGTRTVTGAAGCNLSARGPGGIGGQYSVTTANGTPNLTGVSVNLAVGQPISGTGIPSGTTIIAVGSGTAVMSANATATATITATTVTANAIGSNGSFIFQAFLPVHSFSINGGSNVTGFEFQNITITEVFSGITPVNRLNLMDGRNTNGTALDATGSATNFAISSTPGTSLRLLGASATGLTRTNTATYEVTLPSSYIPGRDVTLTASANRTGTGTAGTNTVDFAAYRIADDGTQGADLVTTTAQAITGTAADYAFTVTGTGLVPGDRLLLSVVTVMQETGAVNPLTAQVNSIRVS
jgi:hypothetical protein